MNELTIFEKALLVSVLEIYGNELPDDSFTKKAVSGIAEKLENKFKKGE